MPGATVGSPSGAPQDPLGGQSLSLAHVLPPDLPPLAPGFTFHVLGESATLDHLLCGKVPSQALSRSWTGTTPTWTSPNFTCPAITTAPFPLCHPERVQPFLSSSLLSKSYLLLLTSSFSCLPSAPPCTFPTNQCMRAILPLDRELLMT